MKQLVQEGKATLPIELPKVVSRAMPVFYNPVMKHNRDFSLLVLLALEKKHMSVALPLAGSGVRGIRMLKELPSSTISTLYLNDFDQIACKHMITSLRLNKIPSKKIYCMETKKLTLQKLQDLIQKEKKEKRTQKILVTTLDANDFLLAFPGYDYIDIDPFGSPNAFLDSAIKRLSRDGVLGVTATDTAALTGSSAKACRRKYWAEPLHTELMHEMGLRILIRKVQLIGAQYDKALFPLVSFSKDHYIKIFFICSKGKKEVDSIISQHKTVVFEKQTCGPVWIGRLHDQHLLAKMTKLVTSFNDPALTKFVGLLFEESTVSQVGFYDLHTLAKKEKISPPKLEVIKKILLGKGFSFARAHCCPTGIKTNAPLKEVVRILNDL